MIIYFYSMNTAFDCRHDYSQQEYAVKRELAIKDVYCLILIFSMT